MKIVNVKGMVGDFVVMFPNEWAAKAFEHDMINGDGPIDAAEVDVTARIHGGRATPAGLLNPAVMLPSEGRVEHVRNVVVMGENGPDTVRDFSCRPTHPDVTRAVAEILALEVQNQ